MSSSERSAADAVMILESLARVLRTSPHGSPGADNEIQAGYVDDAVGALIRDANVSADELDNHRRMGGREWDGALLYALFPDTMIQELHARLPR
ncbi:hypothetical protein N8D74_17655 (plasmid) [Curtobacterium flaccumfaciens]|uniref:Uncharacterized protein n=2 Tax=Microbacteriaceae TaxID=85023 RepID=A0A9Q9T5D7_9MICO|nr:hypothetical protein [Curtobacterium flaccumfaciens]MCS6563584.1 hypothetical protein [Curtobacterium flaccumfaciens pv. poinsettiae]UXN27206.1 hypothetical protein N8D74_17655 [Curtobacterium flaccumfaciens]UXN30463.1 hypothetical protein N8D75_17685 [Curtobacterium flaccumfaciens]UYC82759.1 hypothetical protein OE229_17645 [Curtobacterium flaccumfaciens pv. poinsettiae]WQM79109.1 hypothetical protein PCFP21_285 [Curtobacterium flaccumfaciens pv. poinsettiae]